MNSGVYIIRNNINGKVYVGSAIVLKRRKYEHFRMLKKGIHYSKKLTRAINKYGLESFEFITIQHCSREQLIPNNITGNIEVEQFWIDYFDSYKNGYNGKPNANSSIGFRHSKDTIEKIRILKTGTKASEETKEKMRKNPSPFKNKKHTNEAIEKNRIAHIGKEPGNKGKYKYDLNEIKNLLLIGFNQNQISKKLNIPVATLCRMNKIILKNKEI